MSDMPWVRVVYAEMLAKGPEHSPFNRHPQWLIDAVERGDINLSTKGARDYAVMDVKTPGGVREAMPGDTIWYENGVLTVAQEAKDR